jgi:hypothetical protein
VTSAAITLCVASQRVFVVVVVVYFVIDSVRKLLDTPSYASSYVVSIKVHYSEGSEFYDDRSRTNL